MYVTRIKDSGDQRFVQTTLIDRIGMEHADYMKKLSKTLKEHFTVAKTSYHNFLIL